MTNNSISNPCPVYISILNRAAPAVLVLPLLIVVHGACTPMERHRDGWRVVWQDEFEDNRLDAAKWNIEINARGGGNQELQYYTDRDSNLRLEDGCLIIEARREDYTAVDPTSGRSETRRYTSGRINTKGKADWTYGRFEIRAMLPGGKGLWPAIWMLGANIDEVGWPACGEIDIMEHVGFERDLIHANIHTQAYNHMIGTNRGDQTTVPDLHEMFHVYALEWHKNQLDFFVDDTLYFTYENDGVGFASWPFDNPHYLLLNVAVGGTWGGRQGIDDTVIPQRMTVDYVRVYQQYSGIEE